MAGASVDDQGQVAAPPLTDERSARTYSGDYWELASAAPDGSLQRSRPLEVAVGRDPGGAAGRRGAC